MNSFYWVFYTLFKSISKAFFSWKVVNREKLIEDGPVLIVSNHQSFLDPPMLGISYEDGIYFFARKTLFRGIFKWALPLCLAIPIDQENPDAASLKHVIRLLKSGKRVLVFPEGSRTPDGEIHDGMGGIGLILSKTKVPVQPLRLSLIHISEPTRLGMISYAVFCLKKKKIKPPEISSPKIHLTPEHVY